MAASYRKNIRRTLVGTRSRFIAIFAIVALGVGFLAGLMSASPDIGDSMEAYLDGANAYDFKIVSTLGLTDADVAAVRAVEGVSGVRAAYSADLLAQVQGGDGLVARAHSLPEGADGDPQAPGTIGSLLLVEGRWPQNPGECVVEAGGSSVGEQLGLGQTFTLTADNEDLADKMNRDTFTVVGKVRDTYYFSYEREPASVGSGSVNAVFYALPSDFSYAAYTELYGTVAGAAALKSTTAGYRSAVKTVTDRIEAITDARCTARYNEIRADAQAEIDDAWAQYNDAKADADRQLADAAAQLADGRTALAEGETTLDTSEKEYETGTATLAGNQTQLDTGTAALADAAAQLQSAQAQYEQGMEQIESGKTQLADARKTLQTSEDQYSAGLAQYQSGLDQYTQGKAQVDQLALLNTAQNGLDAGVAALMTADPTLTEDTAKSLFSDAGLAQSQQQLAALQALVDQYGLGILSPEQQAAYAQLTALVPQLQALNTAQKGVAQGIAALIAAGAAQDETAARALFSDAAVAAAQKTLADSKTLLDATKTQLDSARAQLDAGWKTWNDKSAELAAGERELGAAKQSLDAGFAALTEKQLQLTDAQNQIAAARTKLADAAKQLADGRATLAEKAQELADGETEYETAKQDADRELADAKTKIEDGETQLAKVEMPQWYVWDRGNNVSFAAFRGDVDKVAALATLFPIFFFLVAALVVLTTMTRMIEEERLQIGTMKALGYGKATIMSKYLIYSMTAAFAGTAVGLALGFTVFPITIWKAYRMMYYAPALFTPWRWNYALLAGGSLLACALAATVAACRATLYETPASLMRPRAPKAGKRVLLERIGPLWRRLSFTRKVAVRNLFRYKKRFWMTVIGVAGCTALLVAAFGISDSLNAIITRQYGNVFMYDLMTTLRNPEDAQSGEAYKYLFGGGEIDRSLVTATEKVSEPLPDGATADVYLMVPQELGSFGEFVHLHERVSRTDTPLGETGAVITEKYAAALGVKAGDTVTVQNAAGVSAQLTVTGVCENYVSNYLYLSPAQYRAAFGAEPGWNAVLSLVKNVPAVRDTISATLLGMNAVTSVNFTLDTTTTVLNMLNSINAIVGVVTVCAGLLALVVLYNLSNINIAERTKEIATIKVLGFYDREVSAYVTRESIALSVIGALVGLGVGVWLHHYIIITVEVDSVMFGRSINPSSFFWALALTLLFSAFVNLIMGRKLKKISMVESMKAPE